MALQHLRSSTANKRPDPTAMAEGQLALNTANASPGLFYKDATGLLIKSGPVHIGATAPNATPAAGGHAGNSVGEAWLDTSGTNPLLKIYNGASFVTVQPVASGTVVSTADTGTVTSTMILDGTILNADINASAAIVDTKLATIATGGKVSNSATTATNANTTSAIVARDASGNFTAGTITAALTGAASSNVLKAGDTMTGALVVPLASAATPSLTFTGDLDTGVFSPGANQLAVSTGGTGRLQIDSSGNIKVLTGTVFYDDGTRRWDIDTLGAARFNDSLIVGISSEKFRVTSGGLVGIGTSSPGKTLDVNGSFRQLGGEFIIEPTAPFTVVSIAPQTSTNGAILRFANGSTTSYFGKENSGGDYTWASGGTAYATVISAYGSTAPIQFGHNSPSVTLDSSGRLGIGTTSPGSTLDVAGVVTTSKGYTFNAASSASDTYLGTFAPGGSAMAFATLGTERARIDSSGRLLVGTSTSPSSGNGQFAPLVVQGYIGGSTSLAYLSLQRGEAASSITADEGLGAITFGDNAGNTFAQIAVAADGTAGSGDYPGRLTFSVTRDGASSPTERMRIRESGEIGTFGAGDVIGASSAVGAGTSNNLFVGQHSASAVLGGTVSFRVWTNGNVINTNNSYGAISDVKLKENIVDASSQWDDLKALQVRNYNLKEDQTHTQIGLVAQEVELSSPGLVSESPDRDAEGNDLGTVTKSVNYSVLYMKAVKALQEAMERIEALEARLTAAGIE
jgi:hypothetical protein